MNEHETSFHVPQYTLLVANDVMYNLTSKRGGTWRFKT